MPNRIFDAAPLDGTQIVEDWGKELSPDQIVTLTSTGLVEVYLRRGTEPLSHVRLNLADLDTVIATLRTARKIVAK